MKTRPTLLIHGGAWAMPDSAVAAHERGIAAALKAGWAELSRGASAVDAVQAAVTAMEDDDTFDAGRGSFLTRDGRVQLDALLMNGENLRTGGVACVERIRNPIAAARLVLDHSPHVYFVSTGAERFARQHGMALIDNTELIIPRERDRLMAFQQAELAGGQDTTFSGNAEFTSRNSALPTEANQNAVISTGAHPTAVISTGAPCNPVISTQARPTAVISTEASPIAVISTEAKRSGETPVFPAAEPASDPSLTASHIEAEVSQTLPEALRINDPTLHSHDTVGAVALDIHGNLAAATSTGGTLSKAPGRVGDSSLIGCGCYADNLSAAVSLTGWGEPIMKLVLGKWAVDRVAAGSTPQQAATAAIEYLHSRLGGHGGIILIGPDGQFGLAHNTPRMAWGLHDANGPRLGITRN